jgi:hypothetical protein
LRPLKPITIPNEVVGSTHSSFVDAPFVIGPAKIATTVQGGPDFELSTKVYDIGPGEPARDIEVVYHPRTRGPHSAEVTLLGAWADGHTEHETVRVDASAREIAEPPPDAITTYTTKSTQDPSTSVVSKGAAAVPSGVVGTGDELVTRKEEAKSFAATGNLDGSFTYLFDERANGVSTVSSESTAYKPPEAPHAIWWDIAALALTLGTAGFGGIAGMVIEAELKEVGSVYVAKFVSKIAEQGLARATAAGSDFLKKPPSKSSSTNGGIAFFSDQLSALALAKKEMHRTIVDGLAAIISVGPGATVEAASKAMIKGLDAMGAVGKETQSKATALQFVEYRARTSMGTVKSDGTSAAQVTSVMSDARTSIRDFPGLLDLHVAIRAPNAVTSASIHGVSKSVAARLMTVDLRTVGIPLRIHPNPDGWSGYGVITRDEAGRIRYESANATKADRKHHVLDEDSKPADPEAQSIRSAERIVNAALSKTLAEWNAPLETDDRG